MITKTHLPVSALPDHMDDTLENIRDKVNQFVEERDWKQFHSPRNLAESISIEAAELLEIFQWGQKLGPEEHEHLREELADVMIYCISMANALEIDMSSAIMEKLEKNARKYPIDKATGNAKKYTKLE